VGFLDRHPALAKAVVNQYQAILLAGAAAFSAVTLSPLPLLLFAGAELMVLPFLVERFKRRLAIEKKHASRQAVALTQEQQYEALTRTAQARFARLRELCQRVQQNYSGLSPESQRLIADQAAKFETVLASCLKRLWLLQKHDEMAEHTERDEVERAIAAAERQLAEGGLAPRVREALEQQLEIRRELARALERNAATREALAAELDSLEALLQLLLQKSVAATDATAFSAEIDDVLQHIEADAASVQEMETLLATLAPASAAADGPRLAPRLRQPAAGPPPRGRDRQRG
jgi:hypothetical protein